MKNTYACPYCEAVLNPSVKILLVVSYKNKKGMILLSPQPGNFKFVCDGAIKKSLKPGQKVKFHCPICSADLTSPAHKDFAELHLICDNAQPKLVEFSRTFGKHATFIIDEEEVAAYGADTEDCNETNFFGS